MKCVQAGGPCAPHAFFLRVDPLCEIGVFV